MREREGAGRLGRGMARAGMMSAVVVAWLCLLGAAHAQGLGAVTPTAPLPLDVQQQAFAPDDEERRGQLARVRALWASLDSLQRLHRGDELLRNVDEVIELLRQDGRFPAVLEQVLKQREQSRLEWAGKLAARGRHEEALAVLELAEASIQRDQALAQSLYALRRYDQAFARVDTLARSDAIRATRLRASFYLQLGAVPLAVEALQPLADEPDIARVLRGLQQKGLHHFRRSEREGWTVFEADAGTRPARTIAYWFRGTGEQLEPAHGVELAMRPAPRALNFWLVVRHLVRLQWPSVQQPREYELAVLGASARQVVAVYDCEPDAEDITAAARRGHRALEPLREAEQRLQARRQDEALRIALEHAQPVPWWIAGQTNYAALTIAVHAAVALGDRQVAEDLAGRIQESHPMWGALVLARAWEEAGQPERARPAYHAAIAVAPERSEPHLRLAEFEWAAASADRSAQRPAAYLRAQKAARQLQERRPADGLWLRARIAYALEGYALAGALLRQLGQGAEVPDAALEMQARLEQLQQWEFARTGEPVALDNGLVLHAYRSRQRAPEDAALKHHGVELLVLDAEGDLVETFALTSQGVPPTLPRQYRLDRIDAFGMKQLRMYGAKPPALERMVQGVAAL